MQINEPDDGRSYGMAAVANWIDDDAFPLTVTQLEQQFGDRHVMLDRETTVTFADVLDRVDRTEFEEFTDLWRSLGDVFRDLSPPAEPVDP